MHSIVYVPSTLNYAKTPTPVSWVEKACALVIMLHHGVPASALALADCSYLIRKMSSFPSHIYRNGSHCDSKEKIIQGRYSIPVNGFDPFTDIRTGFSVCLADFCVRGHTREW